MVKQDVNIVVALNRTFERSRLDTLTELPNTGIKWLAKPFYSVGSNVARDFDVTVSFHRD